MGKRGESVAARWLQAAGVRVIVLEARDRIGGRILTVRDRHSPLPIELGAEFVHGEAEEIREIADAAKFNVVDIAGDRWHAAHGRFSRFDDFWESIGRILGHADPLRKPDRPLSELLAEKPGGRRFAKDRTLAREFVEGFHAAELNRISERAIADGGNPGDDTSEQRIGRLKDGFEPLVKWLASPLDSAIRLERVVSDIDWSAGRVRVSARHSRRGELVEASAAIITVPVSLLHAGVAGSLKITPEVPSVREAAACAAMGHVQKVALIFDTPLVEILDERNQGRLTRLSFMHASGVPVPVWWTSYPIRSGLVIGWAGGPAAISLDTNVRKLADRAVAALADAVGFTKRRVSRHLVRTFTHNWTRDPYSQGAYSYAVVGGSDVGKRLSRPVHRTLFFAGEAANHEGRTGTVHGAIASGYYAAEQVLRALARG
jgi:monoamine oxidase